MLINYLLPFLVLVFFIHSCRDSHEDFKKWEAEIVEVEKAFSEMAQREGLAKAFAFYAASDGVIKRKNQIIKGKEAIKSFYDQDIKPGESLVWTPTFVDVSASGDLAYTYGNFTFSYPDTLGAIRSNHGIFHTVWKRQEDGHWRFVWD